MSEFDGVLVDSSIQINHCDEVTISDSNQIRLAFYEGMEFDRMSGQIILTAKDTENSI